MTQQEATTQLAPPTEPARRRANDHFEYAHRAVAGGDYNLAIQFLRSSCRLDPANLPYRQALRKAEKAKYHDNRRGGLLAPLTTLLDRLRLRGAVRRGDHVKALEYAEAILARNPWDKGAQLHLADAAVALGLPALAVWALQQTRDKHANDPCVNRALARLLEAEGRFNQAIQVWELVRLAVPGDREAQDKVKQLGATETIARGNYEKAIVTARVQNESDEEDQEQPPPPPVSAPRKSARVPIVRQEPVSAEHYLRQAALCSREGRFDEARAILEQGLAAVRQAAELTLALEDLEIEPLRQQLAGMEPRLQARPDDEALRRDHAGLAAEINARELAYHRRRLEHDPTDNENRFQLAVRLFRAGQVEPAIGELQALRSDARLRWKVHYHLGRCFEERRTWQLARRNYEEALKCLPAVEVGLKKDLLLRLARGHAAAGETQRAIELGLDLADVDFAYGDIGRLLDEWQRTGE